MNSAEKPFELEAEDRRAVHGTVDSLVVHDRFWRVPPEVYEPLNDEFGFDFDPCPCPRPDGYDSLAAPWGKVNFVNPPFRQKDGVRGRGPTAFVHKAIAEAARGNTSVLLLPVQSYVNLLLAAGAELRSAGRVRWMEAATGKRMRNPSPIVCAVVRPDMHNMVLTNTEAND